MSLSPEHPYRLGLEIAGVSMELCSFRKWEEEPEFRPFVKTAEAPDYRIVFRQTDALPAFDGTVLHEDVCYRVHPDGSGGYLRSFFDPPRDFTPYAVGEYDHENGMIRIACLPKGSRCVSQLHNSFFHIGFEAMLLHRRRLCLHAACVDTGLGGLLFSGPSGIGKSTQAELWHRLRGARHINGDRPILSREGDRWLAWGSPFAGSSRIHVNEHCPVRAIVMLTQAKHCTLRRLTLPEAFRAVWSGLTVYSWDRDLTEKAADLAMELAGTVPVYSLACTPDEDAVACLERELEKEGACE